MMFKLQSGFIRHFRVLLQGCYLIWRLRPSLLGPNLCPFVGLRQFATVQERFWGGMAAVPYRLPNRDRRITGEAPQGIADGH
jgi:hypothetical protein